MRRVGAWVLVAAATFAAVAWQIATGVGLSDGVFAYPLDDTYIHLTIAKNLARLGVWAINPADPTSASSSPLWTLALGVIGFLGVSFDYLPLAGNLLAALGLLIVADQYLQDAGLPVVLRGVALLVLSIMAPLPSLIVMGMEHTLQAAACVLYLLALRRSDRAPWRRVAMVSAALMPMIRFEILVVVMLGAATQWRQSRRYALLLAAAGATAVVLFAGLSLALGWEWLPNSVLVKGADSRTLELRWAQAGENLRRYRELAWLAGAAGVLALLRLIAAPYRHAVWLVVGTLTVHSFAAPPNDQYRYDAYVEVLVVLMFSAAWWNAATRWADARAIVRLAVAAGLALAAVIAAVDSYPRARMLVKTPLAMRNIADQQGQTVRFIRDHLTIGGPVVVSDIGWVAYAGGRDVVDFFGLGDSVIAHARIHGRYNQRLLADRAEQAGAQVAILHALPHIPRSWIRVAEAQISGNVVSGSDTVSVYATTVGAADTLRRDFAQFAKTLPDRTVARLVTAAGTVRLN